MCVCRQHFDRIIGIEKEEEEKRDESSPHSVPFVDDAKDTSVLLTHL